MEAMDNRLLNRIVLKAIDSYWLLADVTKSDLLVVLTDLNILVGEVELADVDVMLLHFTDILLHQDLV